MSLPMAILAGGLATRLRPLTENIPKALVDVAGRPFVAHQLELLRSHGVDRVVLCLGHLGEMVRETLGDGRAFGVRVDYSFDGPTQLGTGGALKRALPLLGEAFFVLYGDSYLEVDYQAVGDAFRRSGKLGLMTVLHNEGKWDRSNVLLRDGQIACYDKHRPTPEMQHIDYGLGVLSEEALRVVPDGAAYDLADVYESLGARGELAGFEVTRRFYEIGSIPGLEEARQYLASKGGIQ